MLSLLLVTLGLTAISAYAHPEVRAASDLEVSLSTPADKVASVSDLRVVATVKNTGDKNLKILKFGTVLDDEHHTRSFFVSKDGKEIPFTGIEVPTPTNQVSEDGRVVIPAGGNVTVEHDVSALYDFSASGPGTFTFSPVSNFQVIEPDGTTHIETTDARSVAVTIAAVSRHEPGLEKREMIGCADWKNGFTIRLSVLEARFMANVTALYIKKWGSNDQLYKDYFGSSPVDDVVSKFTSIVDGKTASGVLECSDGPLKICRDTSNPAYNHDQNIYFCRSFYAQLPLLSLCEGDPAVNEHNIRSATMLHYLLKALDPSMKNFQMTCASHVEIGFPNRANVLGNYVCFASKVMVNTKCEIPG